MKIAFTELLLPSNNINVERRLEENAEISKAKDLWSIPLSKNTTFTDIIE